MKVRIEIDEGLAEETVVIHCRELDEKILRLQRMLQENTDERQLMLRKGNTEYYQPLSSILFFETENKEIRAHTREDMFETPYKLYQLEELLPGNFMRVSKSTIVNLNKVYSITRDLGSLGMIAFRACHKKVYVSRHYYKALMERLNEKRTL